MFAPDSFFFAFGCVIGSKPLLSCPGLPPDDEGAAGDARPAINHCLPGCCSLHPACSRACVAGGAALVLPPGGDSSPGQCAARQVEWQQMKQQTATKKTQHGAVDWHLELDSSGITLTREYR